MPIFSFRNTTTDEITELTGPVPFDVSGLLPAGTYAVRAMSDEAGSTITIAAQPTIPGQVTGLTVTSGDTQNTLNWAAPIDGGSPLTDYVIEVDSGAGFDTLADGTGVGTSFVHNGLTNDTTYSYRVSAQNANGTGPVSNVASGTPTGEFVIASNGDGTFSFQNYDGSNFTLDIEGASYGPFSFNPADLTTGPVNLIAPVASGATDIGDTATVTAGIWAYDDSGSVPAIGYQWRLDGTDITGEIADSYQVEAPGLLTAVVTVDQAGVGARAEPSNALSIAGAGTQPEAAMVAHWLFGNDNTGLADLKSGAIPSITGSGINSTSSNAIRLTGAGSGLLSDVAETANCTWIAVIQRTTANTILGGTKTPPNGSAGFVPFVIGPDDYYVRRLNGESDQTELLTPTLPDGWVFLGISASATGDELLFIGDQTGAQVVSGTPGRGTLPSQTLCLGGSNYTTGFTNDFECAEWMVSNGYTDAVEMEAIYQRSLTRLGARGISLT
ncbi:MAG: fibronectin type III domain-containing protein [Paracoccaceae bacterium]